MTGSVAAYLELKVLARRRAIRIRRPHSPFDFIYGCLIRVLIGIISLVVPAAPVVVWAAFFNWQMTQALIVVYGTGVAGTVLVGEHLRSRIFERVFLSSKKDKDYELSLRLIREAWANETPTKVIGGRTGVFLARNRYMKRAFDFIVSAVSLLAFAPLFALVALFIKVESKGPIFHSSLRRNIFGHEVLVKTFRTTDAKHHVTVTGRFLRRTNIDELPQLFNILLGHMTIIGPRPMSAALIPNDVVFDSDFIWAKAGILDPVFPSPAKLVGHRDHYVHEWSKYAASWTLLSDMKRMFLSVWNELTLLGEI